LFHFVCGNDIKTNKNSFIDFRDILWNVHISLDEGEEKLIITGVTRTHKMGGFDVRSNRIKRYEVQVKELEDKRHSFLGIREVRDE
jgi:hypothetical protein